MEGAFERQMLAIVAMTKDASRRMAHDRSHAQAQAAKHGRQRPRALPHARGPARVLLPLQVLQHPRFVPICNESCRMLRDNECSFMSDPPTIQALRVCAVSTVNRRPEADLSKNYTFMTMGGLRVPGSHPSSKGLFLGLPGPL